MQPAANSIDIENSYEAHYTLTDRFQPPSKLRISAASGESCTFMQDVVPASCVEHGSERNRWRE